MRKFGTLFLVVALLFVVGWTYHNKDGHNVHYHTMTFDTLTVGATQVAFAIECEKMHIQAATGNGSEEIYIGKTGVLTTDNGYELVAADSVTIDTYVPATGANALFAIATAAAQTVHYICYN